MPSCASFARNFGAPPDPPKSLWRMPRFPAQPSCCSYCQNHLQRNLSKTITKSRTHHRSNRASFSHLARLFSHNRSSLTRNSCTGIAKFDKPRHTKFTGWDRVSHHIAGERYGEGKPEDSGDWEGSAPRILFVRLGSSGASDKRPDRGNLGIRRRARHPGRAHVRERIGLGEL